MVWPLVAAVVGSVASAAIGSNAAKKAANASQQATDASLALQREALVQQQANTATTRTTGDAATNALADQLGLSQASKDQARTQALTQYLQQNPDVAKGFQQAKANGYRGNETTFADEHFEQYGKGEGRVMPEVKPGAPAQDGPARPELVQTPAYQAPTLSQTPAYQAPTMERPDSPALDVSLGSYEKAPDYEWQQSEARRGTLAGAAATGSLRSGAAAKALQDRAQQIAYGDYTNWRNFTTGQYNTDRARADQNFNADRNALTQNAQFGYNALTDQNRFKDSAAIDASQYGFNALTQQNNQTNQYQQQAFNTDRAFTADQKQQGVNNLFTLAGNGVSATAGNNAAISSTANNNTNALFSNAATQGNAALATAGQTQGVIGQGVNALSSYLGSKDPNKKLTNPGPGY